MLLENCYAEFYLLFCAHPAFMNVLLHPHSIPCVVQSCGCGCGCILDQVIVGAGANLYLLPAMLSTYPAGKLA